MDLLKHSLCLFSILFFFYIYNVNAAPCRKAAYPVHRNIKMAGHQGAVQLVKKPGNASKSDTLFARFKKLLNDTIISKVRDLVHNIKSDLKRFYLPKDNPFKPKPKTFV